jgi:hypothetical protein
MTSKRFAVAAVLKVLAPGVGGLVACSPMSNIVSGFYVCRYVQTCFWGSDCK